MLVSALAAVEATPGLATAFHSLPIKMHRFSERLRVLAAAPECCETLGSLLVKIGSMTPSEDLRLNSGGSSSIINPLPRK